MTALDRFNVPFIHEKKTAITNSVYYHIQGTKKHSWGKFNPAINKEDKQKILIFFFTTGEEKYLLENLLTHFFYFNFLC